MCATLAEGMYHNQWLMEMVVRQCWRLNKSLNAPIHKDNHVIFLILLLHKITIGNLVCVAIV